MPLLPKYCIEFIEFICYNRWRGLCAVTLAHARSIEYWYRDCIEMADNDKYRLSFELLFFSKRY